MQVIAAPSQMLLSSESTLTVNLFTIGLRKKECGKITLNFGIVGFIKDGNLYSLPLTNLVKKGSGLPLTLV